MNAKWSVWEVVTDHLETLVDERTRKVRIGDYTAFFGFPTVCGAVAFFLDAEVSKAQNVLAGVAVFTALLFGLFVHVFTLGMRIADDTRLTESSRLTRMVDQLQANVGYATLIGLIATGVLTAIIVVFSEDAVHRALSAPVIALLLHLFMTLLMVLKRMRATYYAFRRLRPHASGREWGAGGPALRAPARDRDHGFGHVLVCEIVQEVSRPHGTDRLPCPTDDLPVVHGLEEDAWAFTVLTRGRNPQKAVAGKKPFSAVLTRYPLTATGGSGHELDQKPMEPPYFFAGREDELRELTASPLAVLNRRLACLALALAHEDPDVREGWYGGYSPATRRMIAIELPAQTPDPEPVTAVSDRSARVPPPGRGMDGQGDRDGTRLPGQDSAANAAGHCLTAARPTRPFSLLYAPP